METQSWRSSHSPNDPNLFLKENRFASDTARRLVLAHQAREAAKAKEFRLLKMAAAAVADMEEMVKKRLDAETEAMTLEDHRSREVRRTTAASAG